MSNTVRINRNYLWSETFVNELYRIGVTHACVAPGSRSTPLTLAIAMHTSFSTYVHVDERSCAFFALGLAKSTGRPVLLICTSGTAAAEFYPAIIEAYQSRIPLIVCTADRPPESRDTGANQTINQNNLFSNHIRWYFDVGLPEVTRTRLRHVRGLARRAVQESSQRIPGPVHLNFPFRKPFEPDETTDEVPNEIFAEARDGDRLPSRFSAQLVSRPSDDAFDEIESTLSGVRRGLITVGPNDFDPSFTDSLVSFAEAAGFPVLADGASNLRFGPHDKSHICTHYSAYVENGRRAAFGNPDLILHFGSMVSSAALERYLAATSSPIYYVSTFGEWFDPVNAIRNVITCDPVVFCRHLEQRLLKNPPRRDNAWKDRVLDLEQSAEQHRMRSTDCVPFLFEGKVFSELSRTLPPDVQLFVSNSMPIRDLDYFSGKREQSLNVLVSRGASGIDGITSTALGVAAGNGRKTVLVTGDLAFYHDMNGLLAGSQYEIPLVIILVNNNGGGIFEMLPVRRFGAVYERFFRTPLNIDFEPIVRGFGVGFVRVNDWNSFGEQLKVSLSRQRVSVIELVTDAAHSAEVRRQYVTGFAG